MPRTYDQFTFQDALSVLGRLDDAQAKINQDYYAGNHWRKGDGWIGPRPSLNEPGQTASTVWGEIEKSFISKNAIKEVVNRHRDGVIGREASWSFTVRRPLGTTTDAQGKTTEEQPTADEQKLIKEAEAALTEWWDRRFASGDEMVMKAMQEAAARMLTAGRGVLRLFVPETELAEVEETHDLVIPQVATLEEALDMIYLHAPALAVAGVHLGQDTLQPLGVFTYQINEPEERESETQKVELHFLDEQKKSVIKILSAGEGPDPQNPQDAAALDLGGNLQMYQMKRDRLVTEQVVQNNNLINMALTMLGRNVVQGGFLERILLNAQLPGTIEVDKDTGQQTIKPTPFKVGPGTTNRLMGAPIYGDPTDPTRITGYTTPSVVYRDPVAVDTFKATAEVGYVNILDETCQLHALISGDATASGESRIQALGDFLKSLLQTKSQIDAAGRWLLETALAMASEFTGQPGRFASLRAVFDSQIDAGPIPADQQQQILNQVDKKVMSRQTAMSRLRIEDPDAELQQIAEEDQTLNPINQVQLQQAQFNLKTAQAGGNGGNPGQLPPPAKQPGQNPGLPA